jgi:hypothetical protein
MTIRQYLRERLLRAVAALAGVFIVMAVAKMLFFPQIDGFWLAAVTWLGVVVVSLYFRYAVECPKCLNPFGSEAFGIALPFLAIIPRNFCQSCGKSVDEQI